MSSSVISYTGLNVPIASTPVESTALHVPVEVDEVRTLLEFLAANVDVARLDGNYRKAIAFQNMLQTARKLAVHATKNEGIR